MIKSHLDFLACLMIASKGESSVATTVSHLIPALLAASFTGLRIFFARAAALSSKSFFDWVGEILIVRWSGTKAKTSKAFGAKVGGSTRPRLLSFHAGRLHYLPSPDHPS